MQTKVIYKAFQLLDSTQKRRGLASVILLIIQSLLDFFSVASFLPLIFLIVNPNFITSNDKMHYVFTFLGFTSPTSFIIAVTGVILLFTLTKALVSFWIGSYKAQYIFSIGSGLADRALGKFVSAGYPAFSDIDHSRELNRITHHPLTFANSFVLPLTNLMSEGFLLLCLFTGVVIYDPVIMLLLIVILLPAALLYRFVRRNASSVGRTIKEEYPKALKYGQRIVDGMVEIKAYRKEQFFIDSFKKANNDVNKAFVKENIIQGSIVRLTEVIAALLICSLIAYTVWQGKTHQETILLLSVYAGASFRMIPSINRIFISLFQLRAHEYLVHELSDLIQVQSQEKTNTTFPAVFSERLELNNIFFGYPDREQLLKNVDLVIDKGVKIALTGKSGEGKTTLLLILLGFINEYRGEIILDGKVVSNVALQNLSGYVPQSPYILDGSILDNIAFGISAGNANREKVLGLLEELGLTRMVAELPQGIDSRIGERGVKLSGGQRQRIAIARALYADAQILLLDEITNQLHESLELDILKILDNLSSRGKTIIMVTHKIVDSHFFNTVYSLEKGVLRNVRDAVQPS